MLSHNNRIIVFHISDTYKLMAVMRIMNKEKEMQESGNAPPLFFPQAETFSCIVGNWMKWRKMDLKSKD